MTKTMVGAKGTVIELLCGVLTMCKRGALGPSASPFLFDDIVLTLDVLSHQRREESPQKVRQMLRPPGPSVRGSGRG